MVKPRILFVIDNLCTGGAEQVFSDIAWLMLGHIHFDVLLILPQSNEAYNLPNNITKLYLNRRNKWSVFSLWKCYQIIKTYDVLHVHLRHTFRYIALIKTIFNLKTKIIFHDHHGSIAIDRRPPFREYKYFKPDIFIGVSEELRLWAIDVWKLNPKATHTLVNLPSRRFYNNFTSYKEVPTTNTLVLVGNIKPVKNQLFAIDIALTMGLPLTLIGRNQDDNYASKILPSIEEGKIKWKQDIDDVSYLLKNYRIGIFTSKSESGPLVILEYLLCGLPFVAYKTGGIAEVIYRYFPEFFVDSFDKNIWIDRINLLLSNPININKDKVNNMLDSEFNPDSYRKKLIELYKQ